MGPIRIGVVTLMLMTAAAALPLYAGRVAWEQNSAEAWCVACIATLLGGLGLAAALIASASIERSRAIAATWCVVGFQALGLIVPDALAILLMPLGLMAGTFLILLLTGQIRT